MQMRFPPLRLVPVLLCCTAVSSCFEPARVLHADDGSTISMSMLDDERYNLINALDFFVFSSDEYSCDELLARPLAAIPLREATSEHARQCYPQENGVKVLGKVQAGRRTILVVGAYIADPLRPQDPCTASGNEEVGTPGQVLAAGCEEKEIIGGSSHQVDVQLFVYRDPPATP